MELPEVAKLPAVGNVDACGRNGSRYFVKEVPESFLNFRYKKVAFSYSSSLRIFLTLVILFTANLPIIILIPSPSTTTCLASEYDNIFYNSKVVEVLDSGIVPFYESFPDMKAARRISDHVPVWVEVELGNMELADKLE